jgi:hypothetical protein
MRLRSLALASLLAASAAFSLYAAPPADLVPAMVALDRAYIPALGLTGQADPAKAKIAMTTFETAWNGFNATFSDKPGFDEEWTTDLTHLGEIVAMAKAALMDRGEMAKAHEILEGVRLTLLESRSRQKIPYFLDSLTDFHGSMEVLLANVPARPLAEWKANEEAVFAAYLDISIARWKIVKAREDLLPAYRLGEKVGPAYQGQYQAVARILDSMTAALKGGDGKALADATATLKPAFVKTFFMFGDFPK